MLTTLQSDLKYSSATKIVPQRLMNSLVRLALGIGNRLQDDIERQIGNTPELLV